MIVDERERERERERETQCFLCYKHDVSNPKGFHKIQKRLSKIRPAKQELKQQVKFKTNTVITRNRT